MKIKTFTPVVRDERCGNQVVRCSIVVFGFCGGQCLRPFVEGEVAATQPHESDQGYLLVAIQVVDDGNHVHVSGIVGVISQNLPAPIFRGTVRSCLGNGHCLLCMELAGEINEMADNVWIKLHAHERHIWRR